jgi:chromate transporter
LHEVTFKEALKVWIRVAIYSFGGPAGQISVMHRILVDEKKWVSEERFLHALNYCMLLPGPEAQQLAVYIGWLLHKFKGGITAGTLFVLPGFISILILSIIYSLYKTVDIITAIFFGLKAAVLAIVIEAVIRIGKKALKNNLMFFIAAGSFIAIFFFDVAFPLIILAAALLGIISGKLNPNVTGQGKTEKTNSGNTIKLSKTYFLKVFLIFGGLWLLPVFILAVFVGPENIYTREAVFFSKAAVLTFGGAYAVLAYISQEAVQTYGWLRPGEMLDGLGMAETTPGPLIQVVQFVGFMGAFRMAGEINPVMAGVIASVLVTWVTFMPSFLWIFLGAPYMEKLREVRWLNAALSGITAAVVGVILNLAIWFSLHTLFREVNVNWYYALRLYIPEFYTLNISALVLSIIAFIVLFKFKSGIMKVLLISVLLGLVLYFIKI